MLNIWDFIATNQIVVGTANLVAVTGALIVLYKVIKFSAVFVKNVYTSNVRTAIERTKAKRFKRIRRCVDNIHYYIYFLINRMMIFALGIAGAIVSNLRDIKSRSDYLAQLPECVILCQSYDDYLVSIAAFSIFFIGLFLGIILYAILSLLNTARAVAQLSDRRRRRVETHSE